MTGIGKLLVFLNLVTGMVLLTWAGSLSINRLEWVDRKTETGTDKGQITKLKEEIDRTVKAITEVQNGYGIAEKALVQTEAARLYRKARFDSRLTKARQGTFSTQLLRVNDARPEQRGLIDVDEDGPAVVDLNGRPLRGVDAIQTSMSDLLRQSQEASKASAKLRDDFTKLTDTMKATDLQVDSQRVILTNLLDEERFLGDAQVNWDEELRTLQNRKKQLERRLQASRPAPASGLGN